MKQAILVLIIVACPQAIASGVMEVGPAVVMIENGQRDACAEDITGLCIASLDGNDAGELELDLDQRLSFVGVALNRSFINDAAGSALLPDGSMTLTPSDYSVEHPVFTILIDVIGVQRGPEPLDHFAIMFTNEGVGFLYLGPGLNPINTTPDEHGYWGPWGKEGAETGLVERDRIRPQQDFKNTSLDERLDDIPTTTACGELDSATGCEAILAEQVAAVEAASPNVIVGAAFIQALVTTDPADFPATEGLSPRESLQAPLGFRVPLGAPATLSLPKPPTPTLDLQPPAGPPRPASDERPGPSGPSNLLSVAAKVATPPSAPPLNAAFLASVAFGLAILLAVLYSRVLRREETLVTERRRAILDALGTGPLTLSDLSRKLGVDRTTVDYHARMLQKASRIILTRHGRRLVLALPGVGQPEQAIGLHARDVIFRLITENGGALPRSKLQQLAAGMPLRTTNRVLKELSKSGRIERVHGSGEPVLRVVPGGATLHAAT